MGHMERRLMDAAAAIFIVAPVCVVVGVVVGVADSLALGRHIVMESLRQVRHG